MMIAEIENLSHAELKAQREAIIEAAGGAEKAELASRYVQARTDAKLRDEKLAEQGKTIDALTGGHDALLGQLSHREQEVKELTQKLEAALKSLSEKIGELAKSKQETGAEMMRADAAEKLAKERRKALAEIMKVISPVLAGE